MKKLILFCVLLFCITFISSGCSGGAESKGGSTEEITKQTIPETVTKEITSEKTNQIPIPDPIIYTGNGDSVISIDHPDQLSVFYITGNLTAERFSLNGSPIWDNFWVTGYDKDNYPTGRFVRADKPFSGLFLDSGEPTSSFDIKATGDWSIEVRSARTCKVASIGETITGTGCDVILLDGKVNSLKISGNTDKEKFTVHSFGALTNISVYTKEIYDDTIIPSYDPEDFFAKELKPYIGSQFYPTFLKINAVGDWSILIE